MPIDNQGKYQLNNQRLNRANAMGAGASQVAEAPEVAEAVPVPFATLYDNGDGTGYSEMADGTRSECPDMEGVKAMLAPVEGGVGGEQVSPPQDQGDWAV